MTDAPPAPSGVRGLLDRTPRWARGTIGLVSVALGVVVVSRPTTSLGVLAVLIGAGLILQGVLELVSGRRPWRVPLAVLWAAGGLLVLTLPGLTVRVVALVVGIGLLVRGALLLASALRLGEPLDARIASIALGAASAIFGVLALAWPDVALLVVAVVFGATLIIGGLLGAWGAIRGPREHAAPSSPGPLRRWLRTVAALVAVLLAVGAGAVSMSLHGGTLVVDEFYAAPRDVPPEPGELIRAEPFTRGVPDGATAWRILYTSTRGDGAPAVASGIVVVPGAGAGDWPVIDWDHGTTGAAQQCAPSLLAEPFESGALFLLPQILEQGWALVATDYIGLGTEGPHAYLVGADAAHASLDAVRAARQLDEADLGSTTVVWGHSQGGGAALWTGALAGDYAPDVVLSGVAALAPAADLPGLFAGLADVPGGSVFASFGIAGYSATYPDVTYREYVRPGAEATVRQMASRCLSEPGVLVSVLEALALSRDPRITAADPTTGAFGERLRQNVPPATVSAPLLIGQGAADSLIRVQVQDAYVDALCAAGQRLDYRRYSGRDHVELVEADSPLVPELLDWTRDRIDGVPVAAGCTRADR